jgi:hypothetical protein
MVSNIVSMSYRSPSILSQMLESEVYESAPALL